MLITGAFKILAGIFGLTEDQWLVQSGGGCLLVDVTGLAVWWIASGAVLMLGAAAIAKDKTWGRVVGVAAVALAIISQFFTIPAHPLWSVMLIVVFVFILIAFIAVKPAPRLEDAE
jgi:hypothetical protein